MLRSISQRLRWLALTWLLLGAPLELAAQRPPTIAAAANLNFALTEVAKQFERAQGTRVELVFGASGTLTRQIQDGAPFDMFLAADEEFPNQLAAAGLTRDAGVVYAVGRLVIFAPKGIEYELILTLASAALALTGPGRYAVDRFIPALRTHRPSYGIAAIGLALVVAGAVLIVRT